MAAAMPYHENVSCCPKHVAMRQLQEAEGKTFSKFAVEAAEDYTCVGEVRPDLCDAMLAQDRAPAT
jgi:hypothetical protein